MCMGDKARPSHIYIELSIYRVVSHMVCGTQLNGRDASVLISQMILMNT